MKKSIKCVDKLLSLCDSSKSKSFLSRCSLRRSKSDRPSYGSSGRSIKWLQIQFSIFQHDFSNYYIFFYYYYDVLSINYLMVDLVVALFPILLVAFFEPQLSPIQWQIPSSSCFLLEIVLKSNQQQNKIAINLYWWNDSHLKLQYIPLIFSYSAKTIDKCQCRCKLSEMKPNGLKLAIMSC